MENVVRWHYLNTLQTLAGRDKNLSDCGLIQISAMAAAQIDAGDLIIEYEVELRQPQLRSTGTLTPVGTIDLIRRVQTGVANPGSAAGTTITETVVEAKPANVQVVPDSVGRVTVNVSDAEPGIYQVANKTVFAQGNPLPGQTSLFAGDILISNDVNEPSVTNITSSAQQVLEFAIDSFGNGTFEWPSQNDVPFMDGSS